MPPGLTWYRREDYPAILLIMEDAHNLPRTFNEWLVIAETGEKQISPEVRGVRVIIDPQIFPAWCASQKLKANADSRQKFCAQKAREEFLKIK